MRKLAALGMSIAAVALAATPVQASDANGNHAAYTWVVGATTGTATAMAPDGSTITLKGHGTLMAGPGGTATGGGTFTTSADGGGTWAATSVQGFVSYGPAPAGFPIAGATGGETKLRVTLSNGETGVLTIICVLGSPPAGKMEGIELVLGSGASGEFTMEDGGNTVFIAL
jgi:hypothetical protein